MLIADNYIKHVTANTKVAIHQHWGPRDGEFHECTSACGYIAYTPPADADDSCLIAEPGNSGCAEIYGLSQDDYYVDNYYSICTVGRVTSNSDLSLIRIRADLTGLLSCDPVSLAGLIQYFNSISGSYNGQSKGKAIKNGMMVYSLNENSNSPTPNSFYVIDWDGLIQNTWHMPTIPGMTGFQWTDVFVPYGLSSRMYTSHLVYHDHVLSEYGNQPYIMDFGAMYYTDPVAGVDMDASMNMVSEVWPWDGIWDLTKGSESTVKYYSTNSVGNDVDVMRFAVHKQIGTNPIGNAVLSCSRYHAYSAGYSGVNGPIYPMNIHRSDHPQQDPYIDEDLFYGDNGNYDTHAESSLSFTQEVYATVSPEILGDIEDSIALEGVATGCKTSERCSDSVALTGTVVANRLVCVSVTQSITLTPVDGEQRNQTIEQTLTDTVTIEQTIGGQSIFPRTITDTLTLEGIVLSDPKSYLMRCTETLALTGTPDSNIKTPVILESLALTGSGGTGGSEKTNAVQQTLTLTPRVLGFRSYR